MHTWYITIIFLIKYNYKKFKAVSDSVQLKLLIYLRDYSYAYV